MKPQNPCVLLGEFLRDKQLRWQAQNLPQECFELAHLEKCEDT